MFDNVSSFYISFFVSSAQALDLVEKEPDQAMIPYSQLVKFEKYIQQQDDYGELSSYLKKCQIRLWEELNAVLTK